MSFAKKPELRLGYAEYVRFPDDGKRHEIIDGEHYMNPVPSTLQKYRCCCPHRAIPMSDSRGCRAAALRSSEKA